MKLARLLLPLVALLVAAGCATAPPTGGGLQPLGQLVLDSGDQLRIVVLGQPDLSGAFTIDDSGAISMPLIGLVIARGHTAESLESAIAARLRQGFLRSPDVTVQVETFRPIFVMGEVTNSGQYSYVAGLTVQQAIAIVGGFTPRANQAFVTVIRRAGGEPVELRLGMLDFVVPGDTITVKQRLL